MGKIKQGILGGFSGKVAGIIGSSWKGIATIRSMPMSVANPRTTAQVNQRTKFKAITILASSILGSTIKPLWDRFAVKMSGYNSFVKANANYFNADGSRNFGTLVLANGKMDAPIFLQGLEVDAVGAATVVFSGAVSDAYGQAGDIVFIEIEIAEHDDIMIVNSSAVRGDETITFNFDAEGLASGDTAHVSIAFMRADGTITSKTAYQSIVVVEI